MFPHLKLSASVTLSNDGVYHKMEMTRPDELQALYEADADTLTAELRDLWAAQTDYEVETDADAITVRAGPFVAEFAVGEDHMGKYPEDVGVATYEADDAAGYRIVEGIEVDAWQLPELPEALHKHVNDLRRPDPDTSALAQFKRVVLP